MQYEKRIFLCFALVVLVLLVGVAIFTLTMGPGGLNRSTSYYEQELVNILLSGHNISNAGNFDYGRFRLFFITQDPLKRNTLVLGSSRSMQISDNMLDVLDIPDNRVFFNSGVLIGSLGDQIALMELYAQKNELPETIILGLEPWVFNNRSSAKVITYPSLNQEYSRGLIRIGYSAPLQNDLFNSDLTSYKKLISLRYIFEIFNSFFLKRGDYPVPTDERCGVGAILSTDGTVCYSKIEQKTPDAVTEEVRRYLSNEPLVYYENSKELDPSLQNLFEHYAGYLLQRNTRIIFYLSPQHPLIYQKILKDPAYHGIIDSEDYIRRYAYDNNITVIGSFDPSPYNLTSADYYDWSHPTHEAITRFFEMGDIRK